MATQINVQIPPTYLPPTEESPITGEIRFTPQWVEWYLGVQRVINQIPNIYLLGNLYRSVYVTDPPYNADSTGVLDSTTAIQAAINAVGAAGGGCLYFPPGTYLCAGVNVLYDNVELVGSGAATTIKYTAASGAAAALVFGQAVSGTGDLTAVTRCAVRDMMIDGNRAGGAIGAAIRSTIFDGFTLENVHVRDCAGSYGFSIVGTGLTPRNDLLIKNCSATRCGADGLDIKAGLERVVVDGFVSSAHLDETGGDSVGVDIRGQFVSVQNVYVIDCIEIGLRVRMNVGEYDPAYPTWTLAQKGQVALVNCFAVGCRDGFSIEGSATVTTTATGLHVRNTSRYGASLYGAGITINGLSIKDTLIGIRTVAGQDECVATIHGFYCDDATQDAIEHNAGRLQITGGLVRNVVRYGLKLVDTPSTMSCMLSGVTFDNCLTPIGMDGTADGSLDMYGCDIKNSTSRAFQGYLVPMRVRVTGGNWTNNFVNVQSETLDTRFRDVGGLPSRGVYKDSILVDGVYTHNRTITHGLYREPLPEEVSFRFNRETDVANYVIGQSVTYGASASILNVRTAIRTGSATPGATVERIVVVDMS